MRQNNCGRQCLKRNYAFLTPIFVLVIKKGIIFVAILYQHIKLNKNEYKHNH